VRAESLVTLRIRGTLYTQLGYIMSLSDKDIRTICFIMTTADGGCPFCARSLLDQLGREFPEHQKTIKDIWQSRFPDENLDFT